MVALGRTTPARKGKIHMSLNYDYSQVKDHESLTATEEGEMKLRHFCFILMSIGVGQVTAKNATEVWTRVDWHQKLYGTMFSKVDEDDQIVRVGYTVSDVKSYVGYSCNVVDEAFSTVLRRWYKSDLTEAQRRAA
jgi:hypothetical protein